ncbi:hypothetical protein QUB60_24965 [Microcoleus sp. A2-C5]|nr:hypothetical protein [Lyngbya sp. CCAP 1446/10]
MVLVRLEKPRNRIFLRHHIAQRHPPASKTQKASVFPDVDRV